MFDGRSAGAGLTRRNRGTYAQREMERAALAVSESGALLVPASGRPTVATDTDVSSLKRQLGYGRRFRPGRKHLGLLVLLIVGSWVVVSFGRTITQLNSASERQAVLAADTAALSAQLEAGHRELQLVQTDDFQALQARAFGIGAPGEVAFSLEFAAPVAPRVAPLGSVGAGAQPQTPLDAWLRLLFGD